MLTKRDLFRVQCGKQNVCVNTFKTEKKMKKYLAILLLTLLCVTGVLTACNNVASTETAIRWGKYAAEGNAVADAYSYKISLADFADRTTSGALFKSYKNQSDETDKNTYYKDMVISTSGATEVSAYSKDEVIPADVEGIYTITYVQSTDKTTWTVTTKQTLNVTYNKEDITESGVLNGLANWETLKTKVKEGSETEEQITFVSTTETTVVFENTESQRPVSSSTAVDGFYIGKSKQEVTKSNVSTVYDLANSKVTVTVNGEETTREVKLNANARFIDANQILTYIRSLEKGSDKMKDNPTVTVYLPASDRTYTATFGFTYSQNCILTMGGKDNYVKLNSVNCALGSMAFMQTQNLPDTLAGKQIDCISDGYGGHISRYTVTRFRVGNLSYTLDLDAFDGAADIIAALTAKESK